FTGCTIYSWASLSSIKWFQIVTLFNPLTYAAEGLRYALVPPVHGQVFAHPGAGMGVAGAGRYVHRQFPRVVNTLLPPRDQLACQALGAPLAIAVSPRLIRRLEPDSGSWVRLPLSGLASAPARAAA